MRVLRIFNFYSILAISFSLSISFVQAEVIFSESFDNQPDWDKMTDSDPSSENARDRTKGDLIPEGWDLVRSEAKWAPSRGYMDRHEAFEIKAKDAEKARGGTGKAMVNWRDSHDPGWKRWNSDGILLKKIGNQKQVYVEFYIAFSPEMYKSFSKGLMGTAKVFRIYGFTGDWNDPFNYFAGATHPGLYWSVDGSPKKYGLRNKLSLYGMNNDDANYAGMPGSSHGGDHSLSYVSSLQGMGPGGKDAKLPDQASDGYIVPGTGGVTMERVFGPPGTYTKVAFFVKLNSEKGVHDGVLTQWINDVQILHTDTLNWVPMNKNATGWNVVGFGGNDYFQKYPNSERHEEWYAIDDIKITTKVPAHLASGSGDGGAPEAPKDLSVQ